MARNGGDPIFRRMIAPMLRRWLPALIALAIVAGGVFYARGLLRDFAEGPTPETIASASLQAVRAQNRLVPFTARYVAVVTSSQTRFGLSARKTIIMPGTVRYELDLGALRQSDVTWDATTKTLDVVLPPVVPTPPQVDLTAIREYDTGGVLMALTSAGQVLDKANRAAAQGQLIAQARQALPMKLARDAARRAVEQSFALPLRAAGLDAQVRARFADEIPSDERMDRSRRPQDVVAEVQ